MKSDIGTIIFLTAMVVLAFLLLLAARGGLFRRKMTTQKPGGDGLAHLLAPSIMGGVLCILCLCGTSWAWFTASVSTAATTIQTAAYTVSVTATEGGTAVQPSAENKFDLAAGKAYEIAISPTGTAKTGFCKISLGTETYYTGQLTSGTLTFTVYAGSDGTLTVTPEWGTCAVSSTENTIPNGGTIGDPAEPAESTDSAPTEPEENPEDTPAEEPPADTIPETGEE